MRDFAAMRQKLFDVRKKRIPPYKDDKILTAWNGMMISSLAYGARVLNEPDYAKHATRAADFILTHLQQKGRLLRRHREGESAVPAFQDDYAFLALSFLDLYEATFEVRWLEEAKRLCEEMVRLFWDEKAGGFFYTASDAETLIARPKEYYDGAVPSGNSIAALVMLRLSRMTGDSELENKAEKCIQSNAASLENYPMAYSQLLIAMDFAVGPSREIVLAGDRTQASFQKLLRAVDEFFNPNQVLLYHPEGKDAARIEAIADFIKTQKTLHGQPAVYVCQNHVCELPVTSPEDLRKLI